MHLQHSRACPSRPWAQHFQPTPPYHGMAVRHPPTSDIGPPVPPLPDPVGPCPGTPAPHLAGSGCSPPRRAVLSSRVQVPAHVITMPMDTGQTMVRSSLCLYAWMIANRLGPAQETRWPSMALNTSIARHIPSPTTHRQLTPRVARHTAGDPGRNNPPTSRRQHKPHPRAPPPIVASTLAASLRRSCRGAEVWGTSSSPALPSPREMT